MRERPQELTEAIKQFHTKCLTIDPDCKVKVVDNYSTNNESKIFVDCTLMIASVYGIFQYNVWIEDGEPKGFSRGRIM